MAIALLACLLGVAVVIHVMFHGLDGILSLSLLAASIARAILYGAPIALAAGLTAEILRLRQLWMQVALAIAVTFVAAMLSVHSESLASPAFADGPSAVLVLLIVAVLAGLAYWLIWGSRAGWRGDDVEQADAAAIEAFDAASARANGERCFPCLAVWCALALVSFLFLGWTSHTLSGFQEKLVLDVEAEGNRALRSAGQTWATFKIKDDRGVLSGLASSKENVTAAHDAVSDALASVTGVPGVLAGIDSIATLGKANTPEHDPAARGVPEQEPAYSAAVAAASLAAQAMAATTNGDIALADPQVGRTAGAQDAMPPAIETELAAIPRPEPPVAARPPVAANGAVDDVAGTDDAERSVEQSPCRSEDLAIIQSSVILFARQRVEIASTYDGELERLAATAQACAPWPIMISGHADSYGDNTFNERINVLRAIAVREDLIGRGVSPELLVARPAIERLPTRKSNEESAFNRRTEFRLVEPSTISRDATEDPGARAQICDSEISVVMSQSIIHFSTGSARVSEESMGLISGLANAIRKCGSVVVTVEGHTDNVGTHDKNQELSVRRASSVRDLLVAAGADPTRVVSRGFASSQPYDTAQTAEAYALNRRIEFKVSGKFANDDTGGP